MRALTRLGALQARLRWLEGPETDLPSLDSQYDGPDRHGTRGPLGQLLADATPKLLGLADFAEKHGHEFRRIESVGETVWRGDPRPQWHHARQAVREGKDAKSLDDSVMAYDC